MDSIRFNKINNNINSNTVNSNKDNNSVIKLNFFLENLYWLNKNFFYFHKIYNLKIDEEFK